MKYTTPYYNNELVESKDVITLSVQETVTEQENPENPNEVSYGTKAEGVLGI